LETPKADASAAPAAGVVRHGHNRELYIDAFRGLMALVMVQGHVCDHLLSADARANVFYAFQTMFHGSTAPGFLFASGFVAGLPRAPLSLKASVRRARRLLFVLGVGYALHLPYFSLWKTVGVATSAQLQALYACDALQAIAVSQWRCSSCSGRWAGAGPSSRACSPWPCSSPDRACGTPISPSGWPRPWGPSST